MNFIEAENYAGRRKITLPRDYYAETALDMRHRMFTVSALANIGEISHVNQLFQDALKSGGSLAQFKADMAAAGYELPRGRVETIYRTNAQTAYNQGRLAQALDGADSHPYLVYDAIDDSRTRAEHRALDGLVFHIERDRERWERIYPPNGYNCRCRMRSVTGGEARRAIEKKPAGDIDSILNANPPDKGFGGLPMATADLESMLYDRVAALPADPIIKETFTAEYAQKTTPARVQKKIESIALAENLQDILAHYTEAFAIADRRLASKASPAAYNLAGVLTTWEAAFMADYLLDSQTLIDLLKNGGVGLPQAEIARRQSTLAVLTGIFENRLALSIPPATPLYMAVAEAPIAGAVISFDGLTRFTRKQPVGAETLLVLKDKFGRVLPVENLTANPAAGAVVADIGEQYLVTKVLKDQYVNRRLYKWVIYLERRGRVISPAVAAMIEAGQRFWLNNGG